MTKPITFRFLVTALLVGECLSDGKVRAAAGAAIRNDTAFAFLMTRPLQGGGKNVNYVP